MDQMAVKLQGNLGNPTYDAARLNSNTLELVSRNLNKHVSNAELQSTTKRKKGLRTVERQCCVNLEDHSGAGVGKRRVNEGMAVRRGKDESWVGVSCDRAVQRVAVSHEGLASALIEGGWGITIRQDGGRG